MKYCRGSTREVLLIGRWAIKIPSWRGYLHFLYGLIANLNEVTWWNGTHDPRLCPVLFSLPGGLLIVMPRVNLAHAPVGPTREHLKYFEGLPVELMPRNWGMYNGQLVTVDYG